MLLKTLKEHLKSNKLIYTSYKYCVDVIKNKKIEKELYYRFYYDGGFINRSSNSKYLCIVLAGYKEFLYSDVFDRLKLYAMENMDICICSSGKHSEQLDKICRENVWSYLWTERNNVALVQNVAIKEHPKAEYIFKLDEDIFITKDYFKHMLIAYEHAKMGDYVPGVLAPLIPMNGYGHLRILKKLGKEEFYKKKFEVPKYAAGLCYQIESNPEVAKFLWGKGGYIPSIDELNEMFWKEDFEERPCPIRFSIGAIMFERSFWEKLGYFKVGKKGCDIGEDEKQICAFCVLQSMPLMVSENIVVGHLSFTLQNDVMKKYFLMHKAEFFPN